MTHGFEGSQVGATPIEEGMPQKTARKKLLIMRNGTPPDVGPPLRRGAYGVRSPRPENGHLLAPRVDQLAHLSGTERQGCSWGASKESDGQAAAQRATMRMHPHAEGPLATLLLRSSRSSKVPQAASSLAMPPEPPAEHAAAKDRHMHGSDGRHQAATMPSTSSMKAPFPTSSAAMLSAHQAKHESDSTRCMECSAKRLASRSM